MRIRQWKMIFAAAALLTGRALAAGGAEHESSSPDASAGATSAPPIEAASSSAAGLVQPSPLQAEDPCATINVVSSPSRPYWDAGAATTQCGVLESDFGWLGQSMGGGTRQRSLVSSLRYGLTPKLDLRWGAIDHVFQRGGGNPTLVGIGDQCIGVTYRFHEQDHSMPALAFGYGIKIPTANPQKGFGSGFFDHQFVLIASRDVGRNHFDFDIVGALTGQARNHDGASQFGLALTRPINAKLALILESYGGPQPGTADRYGAALVGASFSLRPWLVLDGAYAKTYTAGSPRQQIAFGFTYAKRAGFGMIPAKSRFAHF